MDISRYFFTCGNCDFLITNLGQADKQIECCPSCGDDDIDYSSNDDRNLYLKRLSLEISNI